MSANQEPLLKGLRVLDIASFIAGPVAATVLADFGADVIKIEAPGGDGYRNIWCAPGMPVAERDYAWAVDNRSKRGLCLDLANPGGHEILEKLIADADVLVTNFPPKIRKKLKLDYESIKPLNRRLIYASFSAYGEEGPEAEKTGFDSTALWARSGMMNLVKPAPDDAPTRSLPGMGDHPAGLSMLASILMGLYRRERTGKGSYVSASLMTTGIWMNAFYVQAALDGADIPQRPHRDHSLNALANHYLCADGRWLMLASINEDREAPKVFAAIGRDDLLNDRRFVDTPSRRAHARELTAIFDDIFAAEPSTVWRDKLDATGATTTIVSRIEDVAADPQTRHADAIIPMDEPPATGSDMTIGSPIFVREVNKRQPTRAPEIGEHSREILEELGYSTDAIDTMIDKGIVHIGN